MNRQTKLVIGIIAAFLLIAIGLATTRQLQRDGKVEVEVRVVPADAVLTIDGQEAKAGKIFLAPGTHFFEAKKDGFESAKKQVEVDRSTQVVPLVPKPISDSAQKQVSEDDELQAQREELGGIEAQQQGEALYARNPILYRLPQPFNQKRYAIDYEISNRSKTGVVIQITGADPEARRYAIEDITSWGYDVSDLYIEFDDYKNPLTSKKE